LPARVAGILSLLKQKTLSKFWRIYFTTLNNMILTRLLILKKMVQKKFWTIQLNNFVKHMCARSNKFMRQARSERLCILSSK